MIKILAVAVFAVATAAECCDAEKHAIYDAAAAQVAVCTARGGVPIITVVTDSGGHPFQALQNCTFPCDQRLSGVEKP